VVTGVSGLAWEAAAADCAGQLGLELATARIGSAGMRDAYGEWARLREIDEDGCLLVRPDGYIAWRQAAAPPDDRAAAEELTGALTRILSR
jgi:2,4-dichlorophenol 6-monooxygenase